MLDTILERMNLGALSETLLYGHEPEEQVAFGVSCEERLKDAESELLEQLEDLNLEQGLVEDTQEAVDLYLSKVNPIYFELGMKAGVALYRSLLDELPAARKATIEKKQAPG